MSGIIDKINKAVRIISGGVNFSELSEEIKDILDELVDNDIVDISYWIDKESIGTLVTRGYKMDMGPIYILSPYELNKPEKLEQFYKSLLISRELRFYLQNIDLIIHDPKYRTLQKNYDSSEIIRFSIQPSNDLEKLLFETLNHIKMATGCEWSAHFSDGELFLMSVPTILLYQSDVVILFDEDTIKVVKDRNFDTRTISTKQEMREIFLNEIFK